MDDYKSSKQKQKEWLKQWIKDNPEEYAKKVKEVESFIYHCRKHYSYNYFDELQRDSHYAY